MEVEEAPIATPDIFLPRVRRDAQRLVPDDSGRYADSHFLAWVPVLCAAFTADEDLSWFGDIEKRVENLRYVQHCLLRSLRNFQQPIPAGVLRCVERLHLLPASSGGLPNWFVATILAWAVASKRQGGVGNQQEDAIISLVAKQCKPQLLTLLAICQREIAEDQHVVLDVPTGSSNPPSAAPPATCRLLFIPRTGLPAMPINQYVAMLRVVTVHVPEHQVQCRRVYDRLLEIHQGRPTVVQGPGQAQAS